MGAQPLGDLLRAQATVLAREKLDHRPARDPGSASRALE
jgi:hypothetical protein